VFFVRNKNIITAIKSWLIHSASAKKSFAVVMIRVNPNLSDRG